MDRRFGQSPQSGRVIVIDLAERVECGSGPGADLAQRPGGPFASGEAGGIEEDAGEGSGRPFGGSADAAQHGGRPIFDFAVAGFAKELRQIINLIRRRGDDPFEALGRGAADLIIPIGDESDDDRGDAGDVGGCREQFADRASADFDFGIGKEARHERVATERHF